MKATLSRAQIAALLLPLLLYSTAFAVFALSIRTLGLKAGYFAGFVFYWAVWCALAPLLLLRQKKAASLFVLGAPIAKNPDWIDLLLLALPPLFAFLFGPFAIRVREASVSVVALSFVLVSANAVLEELLWRGVYISLFEHSKVFGWLLPSAAFALWHLVPNAFVPSSQGVAPFVAASLFLGLCWGFVAYRTKSIRYTLISHILVDFSGLGTLFYLR